MEALYYTEEYLNSLTLEQLLGLMEEHGYEEGYDELDKEGMIDQLSTIYHS